MIILFLVLGLYTQPFCSLQGFVCIVNDVGVGQAEAVRGGVTVNSMRVFAILVMHCAFASGRRDPDLYASILARHFPIISDSCSLVWDGSIPLDDEGLFPCPIMGDFE